MTEKKVILISGGSDGLGKDLASRFSPEHQVVILSHNEEKLKLVAGELSCEYVVADVTDYSTLEKAVQKVVDKFSRIDILINNAGIWLKGSLLEHTPQQIEEVLKVNTLGTIFLTKVVLPVMKSEGGGRIINIISQDGLRAKKDRSIYSSSKWALTGFTKCLQEDLSDLGISVTGVYPGLLKTNLFAKQGETRDLTQALELSEVSKLIEFVINLPLDTNLPDIVIKNLYNPKKMDDTNSTNPTLDINPDMMATATTAPTTAPLTAPTPVVPTAPIAPISADPITTTTTTTISPLTENATMPPFKGVIDITPGGSGESHPSPVMDLTPPTTSVTTPGIKLPIDQGVIDITPEENTAISAQEGATHLTDILPSSSPAMSTTPEMTPTPTITATPAETTSPVVTTETTTPVVPPAPVTASASPFAEDPNMVQLGK